MKHNRRQYRRKNNPKCFNCNVKREDILLNGNCNGLLKTKCLSEQCIEKHDLNSNVDIESEFTTEDVSENEERNEINTTSDYGPKEEHSSVSEDEHEKAYLGTIVEKSKYGHNNEDTDSISSGKLKQITKCKKWHGRTLCWKNFPRRNRGMLWCILASNVLNLVIFIYLVVSIITLYNSDDCMLPNRDNSDDFENTVCIVCCDDARDKLSRKHKLRNGNLMCCFKETFYAQMIMTIIYHELQRKRSGSLKEKNHIAHMDYSHTADGNIYWNKPPTWRVPPPGVTVPYIDGAFVITDDGYFVIYESIITKYYEHLVNLDQKYIQITVRKHNSRDSSVLVQINRKRKPGIQVYQDINTMNSFYFRKGDKLTLTVYNPDIILYKSPGLNHFGLYKL